MTRVSGRVVPIDNNMIYPLPERATAEVDTELPHSPEMIPSLLGGAWVDPAAVSAVRDPWRDDEVAHAPLSDEADCDRALSAARTASEAMAAWPARERAAYLRRVADLVAERSDAIAWAMTRETGKPISDSRLEVTRSADTLRLSAEEAVRIEGSHVPLEASAIGSGKLAMTMRFPVGVVSAITPFNAPVNLVMHKLGPAIAAGNAVVLKPSPKAPLCVHKAVECFVAAGGLPDGAINTLYGEAVGPMMVSDPRVDFVTFTGSTRVGKIIRAAVGMKRVALELGGVGPTIVHRDADLEAAAEACARHAFVLAGQSCVSVQNVFVHRDVHDRFIPDLLAAVRTIRVGDPVDVETEVGTLVDEAAAVRVETMIQDAVAAGAEILAGGVRSGAQLQPTVLHQVTPGMDVVQHEIFGPAMSVLPYDDIDDLMHTLSAQPYGLQAGVFTESLHVALRAFKTLRYGGVIVNGTSRWRSDQMPYGGVKDSGLGREGPKYAIRDMTEERLLVLN